MAGCRVDMVIERPPEAVFDYVVERLFETYPGWADDVEKMEQAAAVSTVKNGYAGRLVRSVPGGLIELGLVVVEYEPPVSFAFQAERLAVRLSSSFVFEPTGKSTRLRYQRVMAMPGLGGARLRLSSQKRQMVVELRRLRNQLEVDQ